MMTEPATIEATVERVRTVLDDPGYSIAEEWRASGRRVIGAFPVYVPAELVHAAGMQTVGIFGAGGAIEIDHADSRLQSFVCSICRSSLELGLTGRLAVLDGMIFSSICDAARNLSGVWERNFPNMFTEYLHFPQNMNSAHAATYYTSELRRLRSRLEELAGGEITDDKIRSSIAVYNRNRALLRRLYEFKRELPWNLSAVEAYCLTRLGTFIPVEEHSAVLEAAIAAIPHRGRKSRDSVRVVLEGSFCEQPPLELLDTIEQAGCYLVDDDILLGGRWFTDDVAEGPPLAVLAEAYLRMSVVSSVRHPGKVDRGESLIAKVKRAQADGVLFCAAKFCEPALFDYVLMKEAVKAANITHLAFEFEEKMGTFESIRTQIETFVESILFNE